MNVRISRCLPAVAALAVVLLAVGCNGGDNVGSYDLPPTCAAPPNDEVALAYPAPNATNVPNDFNQIIIASSGAHGLPSIYRTVVIDQAASLSIVYGAVGSPQPAPSESPAAVPFANPLYQTSSSPGSTWPAAAVLQVYLSEAGNCTPGVLLGAFTVGGSPAPTASAGH